MARCLEGMVSRKGGLPQRIATVTKYSVPYLITEDGQPVWYRFGDTFWEVACPRVIGGTTSVAIAVERGSCVE